MNVGVPLMVLRGFATLVIDHVPNLPLLSAVAERGAEYQMLVCQFRDEKTTRPAQGKVRPFFE
jgi:hypothetical protein